MIRKAIILLSIIVAYISVSAADSRQMPQFRHIPAYTNTTSDTTTINADRWSVDYIIASIPDVEIDPYIASYLKAPRVYCGYRDLKNYSQIELHEFSLSDISKKCEFQSDKSLNFLSKRRDLYAAAADLNYRIMVNNPKSIDYIYWRLPKAKDMEDIPDAIVSPALRPWFRNNPINPQADIKPIELEQRHWLHNFDGGIQFSQAYLSPNWYQGGNNSLSLYINFLWKVGLNNVYHPNLLFENDFSYKLGLYSTPQDKFHKYSISEDILQWNFKFGFKAFKKFFYSIAMQFKTQILNNYAQDSEDRTASILSPGDLNVGLGMTYSTANKKKTLKFNASFSPLSYNLKTCIDSAIDPTQFGIEIGKKTLSEIGSNAELTLDWNLSKNINYKSRMFLFSNYQYFLTDWENTLSFSINRFLSTQIYAHFRYDSSSVHNDKWKHFMLKEILSFGFRYTFNTKI